MIRKYLGFLFSIYCLITTTVLSVHAQLSNCTALPFDESLLSETSGQLLYSAYSADEPDRRLFSTADPNLVPKQSFEEPVISPDGFWIAGARHIPDGDDAIIVQELNGNRVHSVIVGHDLNSTIRLSWLSNVEILTTIIPTGVWPPKFYPYAIVNPFASEVRIVVPYGIATDTDPLFTFEHYGEFFDVSPDGKYAVLHDLLSEAGDDVLYDISDRRIVRKLTGIVRLSYLLIWSPASDRLAFYGRDLSVGNTKPAIYIYDINEDAIIKAGNLGFTGEDVRLDVGSWSPDGNHLAFYRGSSKDRSALQILNMSSGEVIETCIVADGPGGLPFEEHDLAWSRDSRYLAVYGVLDVEGVPESESIYLFDTVESRLHEVYKGPASIIGWASNFR